MARLQLGLEIDCLTLARCDVTDPPLELGCAALPRSEHFCSLFELGEPLLVLDSNDLGRIDSVRLVGRLDRVLRRALVPGRSGLGAGRRSRWLGLGLGFCLRVRPPSATVELGAKAGTKALLGLELRGLFER